MYRWILTLVITTAAVESYVATLDLTKEFRSRRTASRLNGGLAGEVPGQPPTPFPITIELLSVDKNDYSVGDAIIYEVSLQNTSTRDVVIPWTPDSEWEPAAEKLLGEPQGYREALVDLDYLNPRGEHHAFAFRTIEGADSVPKSVLLLRPGQRARIKGSGTFRVDSAPQLMTPVPGPAKLRAQFLYVWNGPPGISLDSKNTITVQVVP